MFVECKSNVPTSSTPSDEINIPKRCPIAAFQSFLGRVHLQPAL